MTHHEAVRWLEQAGMRVRQFGTTIIGVSFGEPVDTGNGIFIAPAVATLHYRDERWTIWDHGLEIARFDDLATAAEAIRDYVVARAAEAQGT